MLLNQNEVLKKLADEFGEELFQVTSDADNLSEREAKEIMEEMTERIGKVMEKMDVE